MKFKAILILLTLSRLCSAQNWITPGGGVNNYIRSFYVDSADNTLIVTGKFTQAGAINTKAIVKWNGSIWDSMASTGVISGQEVWCAARFNGDLYSIGPYWNSLYNYYFARWNGTSWDSLQNLWLNAPMDLFVYNNELLCCGVFDSLGATPCSHIARWNGTNWQPFDTTRWNGTIAQLIEYQGDLYAIGNFTNYDQSISEIARWDGTAWHPVGGGFYGGFCHINTAEIYNGELYVGGLFSTADGNPGECIARWNGTTWSDVGGGMGNIPYPQVTSLVVKDGYLFAAGVFSTAGGVPAERFARWDGTNWCGFGDVFGNTSLSKMTVYNNKIYVSTGLLINNDTIHFIAKWTEPPPDTCGNTTGITESETGKIAVSFYPNPANATGTFRLNGNREAVTVTVYDPAGRIIWNKESRESEIPFPAGDFSAGMYYYRASENGIKQVAGKFVIE